MAVADNNRCFHYDGITIYNDDVAKIYEHFEPPITIISDGAYGIGGFEGDPHTAEELPAWYEPHIAEWSKKATPQTTLWFWNREIGWANVHPILVKYGWSYVSCNIWNKGMAHAAGNVNSKVLRRFPQVSEVCVHYVKKPQFKTKDGFMDTRNWLIYEWKRTGLPMRKTNEACGVIDAATRKYFTKDWLWYFPPPDKFHLIAEYANKYGKPEGRPYFSIDGINPLTEKEWRLMRSKFHCKMGITNVWDEPPLHNGERLKENGTNGKATHLNQKPLKLIESIIEATSDEGDVVWEPFGGLCTAALASLKLGRKCYSAETNRKLYETATQRITAYVKQRTDRDSTHKLETFLSVEKSAREP